MISLEEQNAGRSIIQTHFVTANNTKKGKTIFLPNNINRYIILHLI